MPKLIKENSEAWDFWQKIGPVLFDGWGGIHTENITNTLNEYEIQGAERRQGIREKILALATDLVKQEREKTRSG